MGLFNKEAINVCIAKASKPAGVLVTLAGLFSDFAKPYANFIIYFLVASLIIVLIIWIGYGFRYHEGVGKALDRILSSGVAPLFGVAILSFLFWLIMIPVFWVTPKEGVLSSSIPELSSLQKSLLGRFDRLETKIDNRFDAVMEKLDSLDVNSGVIRNPKTSVDYYHNARMYELSGKVLNARQSYEKYFESNLNYLDPFLSYTELVKSMEGPSSTSAILGQLKNKYPSNPSAFLAFALSKKEAIDRELLLTKLIEKFPGYGPAYFYVIKSNFDEGRYTFARQSRVSEALLKLDSLEQQEGFSRYFVDKKLLAENSAYLKTLRQGESPAESNTIDFKVNFYSNDLLDLFIDPSEMANSIFYRIDKVGEFKSTGNTSVKVGGKFYPESSVLKSLPFGKHTIEVKYVDVQGEESRPESFEFEVKSVNITYEGYKFVRDEKTIEYGLRIYFYKIITSGAELQYSLDSDTYEKHVIVDNSWMDILLINTPPGKHTLAARLKFPNGTFSKEDHLTFTLEP